MAWTLHATEGHAARRVMRGEARKGKVCWHVQETEGPIVDTRRSGAAHWSGVGRHIPWHACRRVPRTHSELGGRLFDGRRARSPAANVNRTACAYANRRQGASLCRGVENAPDALWGD